jgi:hypothetical protein
MWLTCIDNTTFVRHSSNYDGDQGNRSAWYTAEKVIGNTCRLLSWDELERAKLASAPHPRVRFLTWSARP